MKDIKRLAAAAHLGNDMANGLVLLTILPHDGGEFELNPKINENGLYLADVSSPRYAVAITGEPDELDRFANALRTLARLKRGDSDSAED